MLFSVEDFVVVCVDFVFVYGLLLLMCFVLLLFVVWLCLLLCE